ncbi:MAG TPA: TRAM domain-containing protein, partial [Candidatus Acidoferrum sp.]|nr:TRAM domain-containing protein [Candidatus Acidoferrum sp.]
IELAKRYDAKIVTNDFNLNKVATLQGIEIMNVNQLANALKPVVLPGEAMRVFILREGKEYNQGVAYLDDGTMVVVDGARKMINKTIDITVTSVHQTTAGKMIFGRYDERGEQVARVAMGGQGQAQGAPASAPGEAQPGPRAVESTGGGERPPRPLYPESNRS